jgi:hypothetical protein
MLRRTWRVVVVTAALVVGGVGLPGVAHADYWVCPPVGDCYLVVETPPSPGDETPGGGGGGGNEECTSNGQVVPCWQAGWGYLNPADGCYYILESPPPPAGDPAWEGHAPGDGAVYRQRCFGSVIGVLAWRQDPPPGTPGGLTPAQLAARAIRALPIRAARIGITPDPDGAGLAGLPVWMWTQVTPETWGPITATASVPGLSVTARAKATKITWELGNGKSVVCANPGTPYNKAAHGASRSPTCGYNGYPTASRDRPGGRYTITATTTWHVEWWVIGGGATGTETLTREATTSIRIDELQVVTR